MGILSYIAKKKAEYQHTKTLALDKGLAAKEAQLKVLERQNEIAAKDAALNKQIEQQSAKAKELNPTMLDKVKSGIKKVQAKQAERFEQRKKEGRAYGAFGQSTGMGEGTGYQRNVFGATDYTSPKPVAVAPKKGKKAKVPGQPEPSNVFGGNNPFNARGL